MKAIAEFVLALLIVVGIVGFARWIRFLPSEFDQPWAFANVAAAVALFRVVYIQRTVIEGLDGVRGIIREALQMRAGGGDDHGH